MDYDVPDQYIAVFPNPALRDDEELLADLNLLPRIIEFLTKRLHETQNIVYNEILVKTPECALTERSDDWLASQRNEIRIKLSELSRQDEALRAQREEIDQEFMRRFDERGTSGTRTSNYVITMREDASYPEITDRSEFEDYILQTHKIHLLQKRLSLSAIQEELAPLEEEHETYLNRLNNALDPNETAKEIYFELFGSEDNELLQNKIAILEELGQLVEALQIDLKEYFSIPGISLRTKRVINALKRSR